MHVGIDVGTTFSTVSKCEQGKEPEIILNDKGEPVTPSAICFLDGEVLIGDEAKAYQKEGKGNIATAFKTGIGREDFDFRNEDRSYSAKELTTLLIGKLVEDAEKTTGEKVESAVITVPAYFDDRMRAETMEAAEAAGVKVDQLINEPTAAAIYYGYSGKFNKTVLVFDLGGGTLDVTVVRITDGDIETIGIGGDHKLGGIDWDRAIVERVSEEFDIDYDYNIEDDIDKAMFIAEKCKKELTEKESTEFIIETDDDIMECTITRDMFDAFTQDILGATGLVIDSALKDDSISVDMIDEVLMVGGSTKMPQIKEFLEEKFPGIPVTGYDDREFAVAKGAAIFARMKNTVNGLTDRKVVDVTAHGYGIVVKKGGHFINDIIIKKNSQIPCEVISPYYIEKGNYTPIGEVFVVQGNSPDLCQCSVPRKVTIYDLPNDGKGLRIDIRYRYDVNNRMLVHAFHNGRMLRTVAEDVEGPMDWNSIDPVDRRIEKDIKKNIVFCVDLSRSMSAAEDQNNIKKAIREFVMDFRLKNTDFGLVGFGDTCKTLIPMTSDKDEIMDSLDDKLIPCSLGKGTSADPIAKAYRMLNEAHGLKYMIILTDALFSNKQLTSKRAERCAAEGIGIFSIGGVRPGETDIDFLKAISCMDTGRIFSEINKLGNAFETILSKIDEDGNQ